MADRLDQAASDLPGCSDPAAPDRNFPQAIRPKGTLGMAPISKNKKRRAVAGAPSMGEGKSPVLF